MSTQQYIINFLHGMAELWPHSPPSYLPPNGGGFARDRQAMGENFRALGQDMRRALKKHEQTQANSR